MPLTFKEVKPRQGMNHTYKLMRGTLDVTQRDTRDLKARNGLSDCEFRDTMIPAEKTSVVTALFYLKQAEGYRYIIRAYTTAERENSEYCNEGFVEANSYDEAETKIQGMAKELLAICLCMESQRCLDLAEQLIDEVCKPQAT